MKKILIAGLFLFPIRNKSTYAEEPKADAPWRSQYVISVSPMFGYRNGESFPSYAANFKDNIYLFLSGPSVGKNVIKEYQVSKNEKMIVSASADCGDSGCRLNLHAEVMKRKLFHSVITYRLDASTIVRPPITDGADDWNGTAIFQGILNPNGSYELQGSFGVYCSRLPYHMINPN